MKLPGMLLKAGLASAGAGIYLYVKKFFKTEKKTKKEPAKNLNQTKAVKKSSAKPRQKKSPVIAN
jgi:hypothetical protein